MLFFFSSRHFNRRRRNDTNTSVLCKTTEPTVYRCWADLNSHYIANRFASANCNCCQHTNDWHEEKSTTTGANNCQNLEIIAFLFLTVTVEPESEIRRLPSSNSHTHTYKCSYIAQHSRVVSSNVSTLPICGEQLLGLHMAALWRSRLCTSLTALASPHSSSHLHPSFPPFYLVVFMWWIMTPNTTKRLLSISTLYLQC